MLPGGNDSLGSLKAETRLILFYLNRYRKWVLGGLFALAVVDGLEVLPPLILKEVIDTVGASSSPGAELRESIGRGLPFLSGDANRKLVALALFYLLVSAIQAIGRYSWRVLLIRGSLWSGRDLRKTFAEHLFSLSASFYDRWKVGDLLSHATTDVEAIRMALGAGILVMADALFYLIAIPLAMAFLSPELMWIALAPLSLIPLIVWRNEREIHRRFENVQKGQGEIAAFVQERLFGLRVIKGFGKESLQGSLLKKIGEDQRRRSLYLARVQTTFAPSLDFVMSIGGVLLLIYGGARVNEGAISLGVFVAFSRYIQKMVWPMSALGMAIGHYQRAIASAGRILKVQAEKTDVPEPLQPKVFALPGAIPAPDPFRSGVGDNAGKPRPTGLTPWKTAGRVEFRNLTFAFPQGPIVLREISLSIEPGERVAFVGRVGAGKSALLGILPRLYPVAQGSLFIDGFDVNDWDLKTLRSQVGYVGQDAFLFSETIFENIAVGLGRHAVVAQDPTQHSPITVATERAALHHEILGLEEKYETVLGERGLNLSGGQRQRLTIARALVREPSILVLDDALSAVDAATEEKILKSLRERPGRNTELIAAHRISSVQDADRIVVLDQGRVVQEGSHSDLLRQRSGQYFRFYETQARTEDLERYLSKVKLNSEGEASP
jgi:ATP-binding cassette subfamily B multidrug efflux pump